MSRKPVILVTGANGQLGRELVLLAEHNYNIVGLSREELDITDLKACRQAIQQYKPYAVIHCAAYTAVDRAESEKDEAFLVNGEGTTNIAIAVNEAKAKLAYVSTDYVFDGKSSRPYVESDPVCPQTIYGESKLAGELAVQRIHPHSFIVRTSWVFGLYGNNFVKTMLALAEQHKPIKVVADQIGSPTYTYDLAHFLLKLVTTEHYGIYHASNSGNCSWYTFAREIFYQSRLKVDLTPCTTEEFPRPAPRPAYSVMEHRQMKMAGFEPMRPWQEALGDFIRKLQ